MPLFVFFVLSDLFIFFFQAPPVPVTQATSAPDAAPAEVQASEGECPPVPGPRGQRIGDPGSRGGGQQAAQAGDRALVPSGQGPGERHRAHLRGDP